VERKKMLYLFYTDDGKGIATEQQQEGMGLKSMRNRVTMLQGEMVIDSKPQCGTRIYFSLPIHTDYA
jgi:two-component system sensor histidine kinase DegS